MTLADIARRAEIRLSKMIDMTWNKKRHDEAMEIMAVYCDDVKKTFGIELRPDVRMHEKRLEIVVDAYPASDYDRIMINALQAKEAGLHKMLGASG